MSGSRGSRSSRDDERKNCTINRGVVSCRYLWEIEAEERKIQ